MEQVQVQTNPEESLVTGRNGTHKLARIDVWKGHAGKLFIEGIGRRGKVLNAGFLIDAPAAKELVAEIIRVFGEKYDEEDSTNG